MAEKNEGRENPMEPYGYVPNSGQHNVYRMGFGGPQKRYGPVHLLFRVRSGKLAREIEAALNDAYERGRQSR